MESSQAFEALSIESKLIGDASEFRLKLRESISPTQDRKRERCPMNSLGTL